MHAIYIMTTCFGMGVPNDKSLLSMPQGRTHDKLGRKNPEGSSPQ